MRFVEISVGYFFAVVSATAAFVCLMSVFGATSGQFDNAFATGIALSPFIAIVIAILAFVPGGILIVLGELMDQTQPFFYFAGGGFIGLIIGATTHAAGGMTFLFGLVAGCAGGLGYWAFACKGRD